VKQQFRRRFRRNTVLQVLLIALTIALTMAALLETDFLAVPLLLAAVALVQVLVLIHSVHAHVDALEDFFAAINYEDFTRRFVENDVDAELKDAFNRILERFQDARAERDLKAGYLDTVVRHVPVPFIAAKSDDTVSLVNNPARRLTGLAAIGHLDDLGALDPALPDLLRTTPAGQQRLVQARLRDIPVELRVSVSEIRMDGDIERLYSIENLSGELSARESSAWRNLIRVLTHEIMNTLTPVTSLAQTTAGMLDDPDAADDIREAISTIGRRSEGLINFVSKYRELLKVPVPDPRPVDVVDLFRAVAILEQDALNDVDLRIDVVPESLSVTADRQLLDQVMINLVKNAIDAVSDRKDAVITLAARLDFGRTVLSVTDNGPGIPDEILDQVFIPFFTTKREGSGIGLSLSRQVMTAHRGDIVVENLPAGTCIRLVFP
jgi:nitrogen fixation/metabolism regulation signal transduction histidine kinase